MADEDEQADAQGSEDTEASGGGEGEDSDDEEGGGPNKMILIIGGVVVLLLGGGAGAYFTGMLDGLLGIKKDDAPMHCTVDSEGEETCEPVHCEVDEHGEEQCEAPTKCTIDDYGEKECEEVTADKEKDEEYAEEGDGKGEKGKDGKGGGGKFVEVPTMLVNLNTEDGTPRFLRLTVQIELKSTKDYAAVEKAIPRVVDQFQTYLRELRVKDLRGSAGIYRLQMELLWRVNKAAAPVKVKDVLFQEILIQ